MSISTHRHVSKGWIIVFTHQNPGKSISRGVSGKEPINLNNALIKRYVNKTSIQTRHFLEADVSSIVPARKKKKYQKTQQQAACFTPPTLYKGCKTIQYSYRLSQWFQLSSL